MKIRVKKIQLYEEQKKIKEQLKEDYINILQTKPTSLLYRVDKSLIEEDLITGSGKVKIGNVEIVIGNCQENNLTVNVNKLLNFIFMKLTKKAPYGEKVSDDVIRENTKIDIDINEYMDFCELKSKKDTREQIIKSLDVLYWTSLNWEETRYYKRNGKKIEEVKQYETRILKKIVKNKKGGYIKNNIATAYLMEEMAGYIIRKGYICPFNLGTFKLSSKTTAYPILMTLQEHYNMNYGKPNQNLISVKNLLSRLPQIPKYENISTTGAIQRRIVLPLEKGLDEIKERNIIKEWVYVNEDGKHYTDEELGYDEEGGLDLKNKFSYKEFIKSKIYFVFNNHPKDQERKK